MATFEQLEDIIGAGMEYGAAKTIIHHVSMDPLYATAFIQYIATAKRTKLLGQPVYTSVN